MRRNEKFLRRLRNAFFGGAGGDRLRPGIRAAVSFLTPRAGRYRVAVGDADTEEQTRS